MSASGKGTPRAAASVDAAPQLPSVKHCRFIPTEGLWVRVQVIRDGSDMRNPTEHLASQLGTKIPLKALENRERQF